MWRGSRWVRGGESLGRGVGGQAEAQAEAQRAQAVAQAEAQAEPPRTNITKSENRQRSPFSHNHQSHHSGYFLH